MIPGAMNSTLEVKVNNKAEIQGLNELSEDLTLQMFDAMPFGVQVFDTAGKSVYTNERMKELYGLDDIPNHTSVPYISIDLSSDRKGLSNMFRKALTGIEEKRITQAYWKPEKAANSRIYEERMVPLKNNEGEVERVMMTLTDLTKEEIREKELEESEARFTAIFKQDKSVKLLIDPESGFILDANQAALNFYGYSLDELRDKKISQINTLSEQEVQSEMRRARARNINHFQFRHRLADGSIRDVEVYSSPIILADKTLLFSIIHDVTDRVTAEKRLKESEDRNKKFIRYSQDVFYQFSLEKGYSFQSDQIEEITGFSKEELMHDPEIWQSRIHPEHRQAYIRSTSKFLNGNPEKLQYRFLSKQGNWLWLEDYFMNTARSGNNLIFDGHLKDITKSKKLEQKLEEAVQRFNFAMKAATDGLWDWNLETNEIYYSENWKKMLGYEDHELENEFAVWERLTHPDDHKEAFRRLDSYLAGKSDRFHMEMRMKHKNGEWKYILSRAQLFQNGDKPRRIIGTHVDVTSSRIMQQELEHINKTKDTFFSIIAHDIRSPFSAIQGLAELGRISLKKQETQEVEEYLSLIQESVQSGNNLLDNLLYWSRLQNDKISYEPAIIKIKKCMHDTIQILSVNADKKDVTLRVDIDEDEKIFADALMLETMIRNLISNAIKFSDPGGMVTVGANTSGSSKVIFVEDDGIGIPENIRSELFVMGHNHSRTGTAGEKGTGLGLILCSEFMKVHGGEITVDSKPGRTRFELRFPADPV